ncbi:hypothetical protein BU15DRAFT_68356 [Melanogaster broomeanus]|nr:hypothetical protein BU15DRAFT_68356 [Melanogaster broomeanus]
MCRAVYYFASMASQSLYHVDSRLGWSISYASTYATLETMSSKTLDDLKMAAQPASGWHFWLVGDKIQTYAKMYEPWLGRESHMLKGFAGTAIELQNFDPAALNVNNLIEKQNLLGRMKLTVEGILADINSDHLEKIGALHFLRALIEFIPALSSYGKQVDDFEKTLAINQITPDGKSNIIPLATNSADEIHVQGMQEVLELESLGVSSDHGTLISTTFWQIYFLHEAVKDFLENQMGISDKNLHKCVLIMSGDGKTFDQLLQLKKYLIMHEGDFESLCCLVPMLELWHTKWTELSRLVRRHWGGENFTHDASTLGCMANHASCPTPADLRKVDFYNGAHLVDLVLNANLLNCWENFFECSDLQAFFKWSKDAGNIPSFEDLHDIAHLLAQCHGTTKAYQHARDLARDPDHPDRVPRGSSWPHAGASASHSQEDGTGTNVEDDLGSDMSTALDEDSLEKDEVLANVTLFIWCALWWREACHAIAVGDPGRVWEILKLWIFTFAGGGNPNYTQYLLELYCNFKWEFPSALKTAIFNNWLVNPHGVTGLFIELDLLQEHSNFWLEEMVQHKGQEFDEPFYRQSKKHTSPSVSNELRMLMEKLHKLEVNWCQPGRDTGFHVDDDFERGLGILAERIPEFIRHTTAHKNITGLQGNMVMDRNTEAGVAEADVDGIPEREELQLPVTAMFVAAGCLHSSDMQRPASDTRHDKLVGGYDTNNKMWWDGLKWRLRLADLDEAVAGC